MLECFPSIMRPVCLFCLSFWFMIKKKNNKKKNEKRKIKHMNMKKDKADEDEE